MVLTLQCTSESPKKIVKTDCWLYPQGFRFSRSGMGLRICKSNEFSGDVAAASVRLHFDNLWDRTNTP